ncbi:lactate dehydrogenase [Litchfieldella qijiaojingensis]|uniref:Lactate dehydrogenase n=1 Tax=Litchfieldella qijiaojingensis TaxID=980347 RepID=A0ABQ2ZE90_9GAMM|nr:Ldh family oxidoreductase [Halomonas qijiaojingensis]GGY10998.1 lactate dehydrogenase [Halomonas qijiaojingensis]
MKSHITYLSFDELADRLCGIFQRHGCPSNVARLLAENCAAAERDGAHSHGVFRMRDYVSNLKADGWVDPAATPVIEDASPGFVRVDARNGFAVPALAGARDLGIRKARHNGAAVIAIRNSHHLGALSLDVEPFAEEGMIALSFINSSPAVVPYGGHTAVFGTNPFAFAAPRAGEPPLVFDMATSVMAHGDVQIAAREGRALEPGIGVDAEGRPTTDPAKVLDGGALLPFGAHKGAAISLMVEILCAALVGGNFSAEVDPSRHPGAVTANTGQSLLLIDPRKGRGALPDFAGRVSDIVGYVRDAGQQRLPGDRRLRHRAQSMKRGIPLGAEVLDFLDSLEAA